MQESTDPQPPPSIPAEVENPIGGKRDSRIVVVFRVAVAAVVLTVIGVAAVFGLRLRAWTWANTAPIHFYPDVHNGIHWGGEADRPPERPRGFLNVYDVVAATPQRDDADQPNYGLDYAPLRLLVMTEWVRWARRDFSAQLNQSAFLRDHNPGGAFDASPAMYAPLLRLNDSLEIAAAVGLFLLTRHWVIRGDRRIGSMSPAGRSGAIVRPFRGCVAGSIAMMLFWFSPATIISTHGWPTWDEWVIPFFVWAIYLACTEWWFTAGVVVAVGAMLKGQQLFVAPLFLLWPLILGKWDAALRWLAGCVLGIAVLASPWLFTDVPGGATQTVEAAARKVDVPGVLCSILVIVALVGGPIVGQMVRHRRGVLRPINLLTFPLYRVTAALLFGIAVFAIAAEFHGSFAWMKVGWGYGTRHYPHMVMGFSDNLAGILNRNFHWGEQHGNGQELQETVITIAAHPVHLWPTRITWFAQATDMSIRTLLVSLYAIAFLFFAIAMAVQSRRNDPHFLVAMTGVWLVFFALMPQIHERYLLYAACVGCSLTAVGLGFTLLNVFLTLLTFVMTIHVMLTSARGSQLQAWGMPVSNTFGASCLHFCQATFPDAGWAVLLTVAIFLFYAFRRSPVRFFSSSRESVKKSEPAVEGIESPAQLYGRPFGEAAGGGI